MQSRSEIMKRWREKVVTKRCLECGKEIQVRNHCRGICDTCKPIRKQRGRPQTFIVCEHCGKRFHPDHLARKYCSNECRQAACKGRRNAKRGKTYEHLRRAETRACLTCGQPFRGVKDTKRHRQLYCSHTCYLKNRRVSHFETMVMDLLESLGVPIERQVKRGRWHYDGAVCGTRILIEADGAFWHSGKKVAERDERKNQWCRENGYLLERVKELEFYADNLAAVDVILRRYEAETGEAPTLMERTDGSQ